MNIYDFDDTIYTGNSEGHFYFHEMKKHPKMLVTVPRMAISFLGYLLGIKTKTQAKRNLHRFLRYVPDIDGDLEEFWDKHEKNIKTWYKNRQQEDDIIISASPEYLLIPICRRLGIKYLMASRVDKKTGAYDGLNCHDEEKVRRLYERFPDAVCDEFYSDSLSDTPLAEISKQAWIIRGVTLFDWNEYDMSKQKKKRKKC